MGSLAIILKSIQTALDQKKPHSAKHQTINITHNTTGAHLGETSTGGFIRFCLYIIYFIVNKYLYIFIVCIKFIITSTKFTCKHNKCCVSGELP